MGEQLTAEQMEDFKEAFQLFDRDADGKLTAEELATVMRALGQNPTQAEVKEIVRTIGGKGTVEFPEFISMMQKRMKHTDNDEQIREAFKVFDKSGTGFIEVAELRHVLTTLGEKLTREEVDGVLKEADADNDGKINLADFLRVMKSAKLLLQKLHF